MDDGLRRQIRDARGKFLAMVATYSFGVFNDNFFKQSALLIAVGADRKELQGYVTICFAVPYLLFAAYAGWLADRFSKRRIVIGAKFLELCAMLVGAYAICAGNWPLMVGMTGLMGLQSAIFGPSLNGSIPELYPAAYVTRANAYLKMVVTGMILFGVACAGFALDREGTGFAGVPLGYATAAGVVLLVAALGVLCSFAVARRPAAAPETPFPWAGPWYTLREHARIWKDPLLANVILANACLWFFGSLFVLVINPLGQEQLGCSESRTSGLVVAMLVGIAIGGVAGSRIAKGERWYRVLAPAAFAIGALMLGMTALPLAPQRAQWPIAFALLGLTGIAGGMYLIPCESFIQVRAAPERKGAVIAASNFAVFSGIIISGLTANALNAALRPTACFGVAGALACMTGLALLVMLPRAARRSPAALARRL